MYGDEEMNFHFGGLDYFFFDRWNIIAIGAGRKRR